MDHIVTIALTGLCFLLQPKGTTNIRALLVATEARVSKDTKAPIPRHVPFIIVHSADIDSSSRRQPDLEFNRDGVDYSLFLLDKERIEIGGVKEAPPLALDGDQKVIVDKGEDRQSFAKVPDLKTICSGGCAQEADALSGYALGDSVGAEFRLDRGHAAASAINVKHTVDFCDSDCLYNGDASKMISLAQQVTIDLTMAASVLTLRSVEVKANADNQYTPEKMIALAPRGNLWISAGSAPVEDLVYLPGKMAEHKDYHFELYYDLIKSPAHIRVPCDNCVGKRFVHSTDCPPILYAE
jgi:hypothetical protein